MVRPTTEQISAQISYLISDPHRIEEIIIDDTLNLSVAIHIALSMGHMRPLEDYFFNKLKKEVIRNLAEELNTP